jgi:hypothetical protein
MWVRLLCKILGIDRKGGLDSVVQYGFLFLGLTLVHKNWVGGGGRLGYGKIDNMPIKIYLTYVLYNSYCDLDEV